MSDKSPPVFRISCKRKDGKPQTFVDYKDETVEKLYRPLGVVFARDNGKYSIVFEKGLKTLPSTDEFWINFNASAAAPKRRDDSGNDDF